MSQVSFVVGPKDRGATLAAAVRARRGGSWSQVRSVIAAGAVRVNGTICRDPVRRLQRGDRVTADASSTRDRHSKPGPRSHVRIAPDRARPVAEPVIRYQDAEIVVVDKPAGMTTCRSAADAAEFGERGRRYLPTTLLEIVRRSLGGERLWPVHRLDRDTSGLVVFARTEAARRRLAQQFREHSVARRYLALVRGQAASGRLDSYLVRDRGDGRRGSGTPEAGQRAITHVQVLEAFGDFSLVECRLETGRTHQIRIHLGEAGTPLAGERVYDRPVHGRPPPDRSGAPRVALHAATLGLIHPRSGKFMEWTSPWPADLGAVVSRLRRGG